MVKIHSNIGFRLYNNISNVFGGRVPLGRPTMGDLIEMLTRINLVTYVAGFDL